MMLAIVEIKNLPTYYSKYVVARLVDCELWYWQSWEDKTDAENSAKEVNGVVIERNLNDLRKGE